MKAKILILILTFLLSCMLYGCSKKNKSGKQQPPQTQQTVQTDEEKSDTLQINAEGIPENADPRLKKAIEKTINSSDGRRREREQ